MGYFPVAGGADGHMVQRVAMNIVNKQSRAAHKTWFTSIGVGREANNSQQQKEDISKCYRVPRNLMINKNKAVFHSFSTLSSLFQSKS
jgi:hypothetical protein